MAILELPAWLGSLIAMAAAIILSVTPFLVAHRLLKNELPETTSHVAETVAVRIGTLHGLILALVFAAAQSAHSELQQEVSKEITSIEHIALHLEQWNGPEKNDLRMLLATYVKAVLQSEWQIRAQPAGSNVARQAYNALDLKLLDLKADTPREQSLRARMISDMDDLQEHRKVRLSLFHRGLPGLFWWMALAGFVITVGFFFIFPATLPHIAMLSVYGAYTGLALYFILALSHPYAGPASIDPSPYVTVLQRDLGAGGPQDTPP
jgi:hypothetical protein